MFCNPLPKVMNGTWAPSKCPQAKMRYGEHCNVRHLGDGIRATRAGRPSLLRVRNLDRRRSQSKLEINFLFFFNLNNFWAQTRCVDVTQPEITCPADVTLEAEGGESYTSYSWDPPLASDVSGTAPDVTSVPAVTEQPMRLRIGNATLT